jgi:hypothetical protein
VVGLSILAPVDDETSLSNNRNSRVYTNMSVGTVVVGNESDAKARNSQNRAQKECHHRLRGLLIRKHGSSIKHDSRTVDQQSR